MIPVVEVLEMVVHDQTVLNQLVCDGDAFYELHLHHAWEHWSLSSRGILQHLNIKISDRKEHGKNANLPRPSKTHV
jgi:hypothetical protein